MFDSLEKVFLTPGVLDHLVQENGSRLLIILSLLVGSAALYKIVKAIYFRYLEHKERRARDIDRNNQMMMLLSIMLHVKDHKNSADFIKIFRPIVEEILEERTPVVTPSKKEKLTGGAVQNMRSELGLPRSQDTE